MFQETLAP